MTTSSVMKDRCWRIVIVAFVCDITERQKMLIQREGPRPHPRAGFTTSGLLNTNEAPDDSDFEFIDSVISQAHARLACLDDKISKLQERLAPLEDERASLLNYLTRNKAILSPLRRMPPELLGEIFSRTLSSMREIWSQTDLTADSPWVLSHTSSSWRAISLSIPSLWSGVAIDYSGATVPHYPLETQIQRARNVNLKIHFYAFPGPHSRCQIQTFELLSQHSLRWEELAIGITPDIIPFLASLRGRLSSLKRLWIQWNGEDERLTEGHPIDCFQTAPSLVEFGVSSHDNFEPVSLPTHQFTYLELDGLIWERHEGLLQLAQHLVEARITFEDAGPWLDIIELPQLRRLHVSYANALNNLKAPALEELSFWVAFQEPLDISALETFIDCSACRLRRLTLRGFPHANTTIQMLQKSAFITELVIAIKEASAGPEIDLLISKLTPSQGTITAPQLRSFFIGCEEDSCLDYKMYLEMLKFRLGARSALRSAALLVERHGPDPETLGGLEALRREGMDLLIIKGKEVTTEYVRHKDHNNLGVRD
ncbi:hypothetical protein C8R45DRAFT_936534 [Mycena sanguinolenta]|nr:hypothetical protein C8R45DRAFT_936534 [Mycena sanguinolenta]